MKILAVISSLVLMATLSGCQTEKEHIEEKAKTVRACVDNGGEWYNSNNGFGAGCHFDTRFEDLKPSGGTLGEPGKS